MFLHKTRMKVWIRQLGTVNQQPTLSYIPYWNLVFMMQLQVSTLAGKLVHYLKNWEHFEANIHKSMPIKGKKLFLLTYRNMESSKKHIKKITEICQQKRNFTNTMEKHMSLKHFDTKQLISIT